VKVSVLRRPVADDVDSIRLQPIDWEDVHQFEHSGIGPGSVVVDQIDLRADRLQLLQDLRRSVEQPQL
jgi:hypothetical protein